MSYASNRLREIEATGEWRSAYVSMPRKYPSGTTHKPCTQCKLSKPLDAYSELKAGALGRQPKCKLCIQVNGRAYTRRTRECKAGRLRPEACDACGEVRMLKRPLHWDHNHSTNKFRGWLCHQCNAALGHVKDDIERLEMLISYLKRGGGPIGSQPVGR